MNKVFASNVQNQQVRDVAKFYEKIYTDDVSGLRKEVFKDLILEISATVYLLLAIIGFSTLNAGEFVVYVVFGFFLLLSCKNTYKLLVKYNSIKNKNYCCPIKVDRRKKIRLGYRFDGGRVCFFDFQAPSAEKRGLGRGIGCLAENDFPVLFGVIEQAVEVDIVHQRYPNHGRQSREAPLPFQPFLHQHQQQICYQRHPYLYLDGICALAVEVFQRKVLFHLFEQ